MKKVSLLISGSMGSIVAMMSAKHPELVGILPLILLSCALYILHKETKKK